MLRLVACFLAVSMSCAPAPSVDDAGAGVDSATRIREATDGGPVAGSPCELDGARLRCTHRTFEVPVAQPIPLNRIVHVGVPRGVAPTAGWPVVLLFQGSLYSAQLTWSAVPSDPVGAYWQTATVQSLLEAGFAVVTPEVRLFGTSYWDTNVPQWAAMWGNAPDHHLMVTLLDAVGRGAFGPLDGARLYAGGISSGGYMTSRMALSYPGRFRALAVVAASWATCGGPLCVLPATLPAGHPPTLFLHGERDAVVPIATMREYEARLQAQGVATRVVTSATAGHEWLEAGVTELRDFFLAHR